MAISGVFTTGEFQEALVEGHAEYFTNAFKDKPMDWKKIFKMKTSRKSQETEVFISGLEYAGVKPQGGAYGKDAPQRGYTTTYEHVAYAIGEDQTLEMNEDDLYGQASQMSSERIAKSLAVTQEEVHAATFNSAYDTDVVYADGKSLIATDHPSAVGSQSNRLATPALFNEASYEQLLIDIKNSEDPRGIPKKLKPTKIVCNPDLEPDVVRVLKSKMRPGTVSNDVNASRAMYGELELVVLHHLEFSNRFFIITNEEYGFTHYQRQPVRPDAQVDFATKNIQRMAMERCSHNVTVWDCVYGNGAV